MNPVLFSAHQSANGLTIYSKNLDDFNWRDRLVGVCNSGFLYVDERVPKIGYYELHPKVLPWEEIREVSTSRCISLSGILFGICVLLLAFFAFSAGWIRKTHTGPGIFVIPLVCGLGGAMFLFGALRNQIVVRTNARTFEWMSMPLNYKITLSLCQEAAAKARDHHVPLVESHA